MNFYTIFVKLPLITVSALALSSCSKGGKEEAEEKLNSTINAITETPKPTGNHLTETLRKMTGCFLVDYSYSETEALQEGYKIDERVYDVNKNKSVKEWIYAVESAPNKIRLQHILFATDLNGKVIDGTIMKHQAEDWEFQPTFWYDFTKPSNWEARELSPEQSQGKWVRKVTNLDDGLRYQCVAAFQTSEQGYAEWTCSSFAPIPGRETRDMGRKDYNTLDRTTRIIVYGDSWLERQENIKTIYKDEKKNPLASEVGKNWFVRLPDAECADAKAWTQDKTAFWDLLREVWETILDGKSSFTETMPAGGAPRFVEMMSVEEKYSATVATDPEARKAAEQEIRGLIQEYRKQ